MNYTDDGLIRVQFVLGQLTFGGSERHVVDLARMLDRDRFLPQVLCLRSGGPLAGVLREAGISYAEAPVISWRRPPLWDLCRAVREFRPHALCVYTYVDKLWGRLAGMLCGVPAVVSAYRTVRKPWYEPLLLPKTTAVVANSRALQQSFRNMYRYPGEKVLFLPNGIDLSRFTPSCKLDARKALNLPFDAPIAVQVARFEPVKDHMTSLAAFARVREELPEALLVLVGHGSEKQRILDRIGALGLEDAVRLLSADSDVPTVFAAADAVLLSSRSESLPRVVIEASACARPVIATDVGGCSEVVLHQRTGFVVPAGDSEAMARRLGELLGDCELAESMGRAALEEIASRHSQEIMAREFEKIILELVGRGG